MYLCWFFLHLWYCKCVCCILQLRCVISSVDACISINVLAWLFIVQIIKILNLYTPVNEFEERVPVSFIRKIQDRLSCRHDVTQTLLMDTKLLFAVSFPFRPSAIALEMVTVPTEWGLGCLKRL